MYKVVVFSALLLSGCGLFGGDRPADQAARVPQPAAESSAQSGEQVAITHFTWKAFENYKFWMTPIAWPNEMGEGYFAVAKDGRSWGLTGCSANSCATGTLDSNKAIEVCQTRSGGVPCILFAHNEQTLVSYKVVED
ncbi:MAG TPA: hypothetical protein VGM59_09960 [Dongiaceae bacterium]|jgi:hypothetical protein